MIVKHCRSMGFRSADSSAIYASAKLCDRGSHRCRYGRIAQRVAGIGDDLNIGIGPNGGERSRLCGRAEMIELALGDNSPYAAQRPGPAQQLVRSEEAVVDEIVRFHERR